MTQTKIDQVGFKKRFAAHLRAELEDALKLSNSSAQSRAPVTLDQQSVGRVSRIDALQGQALAQATERRREGRRVALEQALARIDDGDFGYCLDCDEPISLKRLEIDPATALCIACAQRNEG